MANRLAAFDDVMLRASLPKPTKTEYLISTGAGFIMSKEEGAMYAMNYEVRKPFPGPVYCVALFESPIPRDAPLSKEFTVAPEAKDIELRSTGFHAIHNGHRTRSGSCCTSMRSTPSYWPSMTRECCSAAPRGQLGQLRDQFGLDVQ